MNATFFDLAQDMLCTATPDGLFATVNESWTRILGWSRDELTTIPFVDFVHPEDRERTIAETAKLAAGARTVDFRNRYRNSSGGYHWVDWRAALDPASGLIYAAARDITDQMELHLQLRDREEMLSAMVEEQLRTRDDELRRIAAELHDSAVQHSVAALIYLEQVLVEAAGTPTEPGLLRIADQVRSGLGATRRIMRGLEVPGIGAGSLEPALQSLAVELQDRFDVPVDLEVDLRAAVSAETGAALLRSVREAITNAGKHALASKITVALGNDEGHVWARVTDDGRGMAASADAVDRSGLGLGLAFLREHVNSLDGRLDVDSGAQGTTIEVRLPATTLQSAAPRADEVRAVS
ncbi:MAG: sensory box histidine kinase [Thermoleophilia bacterium]|nr:sensory box histidine kinase [Thermoleophilia bacterium]